VFRTIRILIIASADVWIQTPELADHEVNTLEVEANFDASYEYSLWVFVGGGGGHQLTIKDMKISCLVYDDSERSLTKQYAALQNTGIYDAPSTTFYMDLLLHASRFANTYEGERALQSDLSKNGFVAKAKKSSK